jgi:L-rhamnonate dehydratase
MKLREIRAAAVTRPEVFTNRSTPRVTWGRGTETNNPLSRYREFRGMAGRTRPGWPWAACIATAEDGTWGLGLTRHAGPVVAIINEHFASLLAGENPMATEKLWNLMVRSAGAHYGASGLASHAVSAVDLALWDLKGKLLGRPVYELIGGPARDAIRCYATGNDIDWYLELGFDAIKLCCLHGAAEGLAGIEQTVALAASARQRVGAGVELMMDLWPVQEVPLTVELGTRLAPYRLKWLEDYLYPEDWRGYEEVRGRLPGQTLAAGERWYTDRPFQLMAERRTVDIFQPDVQWVGGVTAALKVAHIAEAAGIDIAMHAGCNDSYGQHVCFALPGNQWGELYIESAPGVDLRDGYRTTPGMALPVKGLLVPSDAPGFGIELTLAMLESAT